MAETPVPRRGVTTYGRNMQQNENYPQKRKYFWAYSIAVAAVALGIFWAMAKPASEHGKAAAPAVRAAEPLTPIASSGPASSGNLPPGPVPGGGIVPGRKDDTDGTRAPTK